MAQDFFKASKSRTPNRPGWSISFRHPLRKDSLGKPGLKMRRGLGTTDEGEADRMVAEMNCLLSDPTWWNVSRLQEAAMQFSKQVVDAFFDEIESGIVDPERVREEIIPIPSKNDGYARVLLVGTTGAGKTSLLRQIIGSDPDEDRFPSTAPAKTTISDIEVIQAEGGFRAAVTFFSEFQIQAYVEECVTSACLAELEGAKKTRVAEKFLNHTDQKFRLSYVLGSYSEKENPAVLDNISFDEEPSEAGKIEPDSGGLSVSERAQNMEKLHRYLEEIAGISKATKKDVDEKLGEDISNLHGADRDAAEELFEDALLQQEEFHQIVHDIMDDILRRFELITSGHLQRRRSGWPEVWVYETDDRNAFIREIRWFSSNYWPEFGRLLTPVVQGIRVIGPLYPFFSTQSPRLVLVDGQGLGHTPDSSSSVTTHITKRFANVDIILLVDNAQQPMQAAPLSVLRAVASSGHQNKLAIAFTHFDQIKGINLATHLDKTMHVLGSVANAVSSLRDVLGAPVAKAVEIALENRCFMLGGVDRRLDKIPGAARQYMTSQLQEMIAIFQASILPPPPPAAWPIYDPTGLAFAIREASLKFLNPWVAKLGLGAHEGAHKEHWTRIKALNRRIAGELDIEYDSLRPVADFLGRLSEAISVFLDKPIGWTCESSDEAAKQMAISNIRQQVSTALHEVAIKRVVIAHLEDWRSSYNDPQFRGVGSTYKRALKLRSIYQEAAPLPDTIMTVSAASFIQDIRSIVEDAVTSGGGKVGLRS